MLNNTMKQVVIPYTHKTLETEFAIKLQNILSLLLTDYCLQDY
jgi:hypothetical protein